MEGLHNSASDVKDEMIQMEALINFDDVVNMSDNEVQDCRDDRGFNILMLASEAGHVNAVNNLIARGEEVNVEEDGESPASLAFNKGHHEVVLVLLRANSKFPYNYQHEEASEELKAFVELSTNMHDSIKNVEEETLEGFKKNLKENQKTFPNLRHFYSVNNTSLLKTAVLSKMFKIYEILLTFNIFLAPHEEMDDLLRRLTRRQRRIISEIHLRVSPELVSEPMMILMRNCKLGPDTPEERHSDFMKQIRDAFDYLFKIPPIAIILKIVAASRNFQIIFDFKRDSVTFLDPRAEPYMNGLFYTSGRVYVAAKDMLDPTTAVNTIGVIAHELCHFAMTFVYGNSAKPYKKDDLNGLNEFSKVCDESESNQDHESIVQSVYEGYPQEARHAELIVTACQMMALYFKFPEVLNARREQFRSLFDYFENVCVPDMKAELPNIEKKFNPFKKAARKHKVQRRWIIALVISMIIGATLSVWGLIYIHDPPVEWSKLSVKQQNLFKNASIDYRGINVKFGDLFANDSCVYSQLSSEHIKDALKGDTIELSKYIEENYEKYVYLTWSNMTEELQEGFLERKVKFQGEQISLEDLLTNYDTLALLNSTDVRKIFKGSIFRISSDSHWISNVFMERYFINAGIEIDPYVHYNDNEVNTRHEDVKGFEGIVDMLIEDSIVLLSTVAGEGKSTTLRNFALNLKNTYTFVWIQFVDLRKCSKGLKKFNSLDLVKTEALAKFISVDLLNLNGFEQKVFCDIFQITNVVFFWNGLNEVARDYKNSIVKLIELIKNTKNWQIVSTNPQNSEDIAEKFGVKPQILLPLSENEMKELCMKYIAYERFKDQGVYEIFENQNDLEVSLTKFNITNESFSEAEATVAKRTQILKEIQSENEKVNIEVLNSPFLAHMVCELSSDEDFEGKNDFNIYGLFKNFVLKNFEKSYDESEALTKDEQLDKIMKIHQAYALKLFQPGYRGYYEDFVNKTKSLEILKHTESVCKKEISRLGILQIYSENTFDFAHSNLADFFIVQYLIGAFNREKIVPSADDRVKVELLYGSFHFNKDGERFDVYRNFLNGFFKINSNLFPLFKQIQAQFPTNNKKDEEYSEINSFSQMLTTLKFLSHISPHLCPHVIEVNSNIFDYSLLQILDEWDELSTAAGDNWFFFLTIPDSNKRTKLHSHFRNYRNIPDDFLSKLKADFTQNEISSLFLMEDIEYYTAFTYAFKKLDLESFKLLWEFIQDTMTESDQKQLLLMENNPCGNALYYSAFNTDYEVFLFVRDIFKNKHFTHEQIQEFLMQNYWSCETILFGLLETAKVNTIEDIVNDYLVKVDKEELKKFLMHRSMEGRTIYSIHWISPHKIRIIENLLERTFDEPKAFQDTLKVLRNLSRVATFSQHYSPSSNISDVRNFYWHHADFNFVDTNWKDIKKLIGVANMKKILSLKNGKGEHLLFDFANLYENENLNLNFLVKVKELLNKNEFSIFLTVSNNINQNALIIAAEMKKVENLKKIWEFYNETLKTDDIEKFLLHKDDTFDTVLHHSIWNDDSDSFLFVKSIYEKYFTKEKIKEIFSHIHPKSLPFQDYRLSVKKIEIFGGYLKELFEGDKDQLRDILSHRNEYGETIYSYNKDKYKLKAFEELLEFSLNEDLKDVLVILGIKSKLIWAVGQNQSLEQLRNFEWELGDFEFFIKHMEVNELFKNLLLSKNEENETVLFEFFSFNDGDDLTEEFLMKVENISREVIFEKDKFNRTILDKTLTKKAKILWEFMEKTFSKERRKEFLLEKSKHNLTALQYSTLNHDDSMFKFMKGIYQENFNVSEIQNILIEYNAKMTVVFVFYPIAYKTVERNQEVIEFLKEIFNENSTMLLNLFKNRDQDGDTVFSWFKGRKDEILQEYEKLLREFYENEKEFDDFLKFLQSPSLLPLKFSQNRIESFGGEWGFAEFYFFVNNYEEIKQKIDEVKLQKLVKRNQRIFFDLVENVEDKKLFEKFLNISKYLLDSSEFSTLLTNKNRRSENILVVVASKNNETILNNFPILDDNFLNPNTLKKLLTETDDELKTALHYSAQNQNPKIFLYFKELYKKNLSIGEIREILSKTSSDFLPFPHEVIKDASIETIQEVAKFFPEIFKDDSVEKLFNHKTKSNETIISWAGKNVENKRKFKLFNDLLKNNGEILPNTTNKNMLNIEGLNTTTQNILEV